MRRSRPTIYKPVGFRVRPPRRARFTPLPPRRGDTTVHLVGHGKTGGRINFQAVCCQFSDLYLWDFSRAILLGCWRQLNPPVWLFYCNSGVRCTLAIHLSKNVSGREAGGMSSS